jgi:Txe/YoeB family toxin of Txe-Axe toxin-antitoxin module
MNKKYQLEVTKKAAKKYKKLTTKNKHLQEKVQKILKILVDDPFHLKLKTHKVQITNYGIVYSSRITQDIRIIWDIENDKVTIVLLDIGGHSGSKGVYK